MSKELDVKYEELTNMQQYVCLREAGTDSQVRETVTQLKGGKLPQIVRSVVHKLERTSYSVERPSVKQQSVLSYSGFQ